MASRLQIASQIRGTKTQDGELFIVTADSAGRTEDIPLARFLERVRKGFEMDIVFVSRFAGGERIIQHVAADPADQPSALMLERARTLSRQPPPEDWDGVWGMPDAA